MRALPIAAITTIAMFTLHAGTSVPAAAQPAAQQTPPAATSSPADKADKTDKADKARDAAITTGHEEKAEEAQHTPSGQAGKTEPSVKIEEKKE